MDQAPTTPNPTPEPSVPAAPTSTTPVTQPPVEPAPAASSDDEVDQSTLPVEQAQQPMSATDIDLAKAKTHQQFKLIEVIVIALLAFVALVALAGWAYLSQGNN